MHAVRRGHVLGIWFPTFEKPETIEATKHREAAPRVC